MVNGTVVKLFISEEDLEQVYRRYDEAMRHLAALHRDPDSVYEDRLAAAKAALEAEKDFRAAFARSTPARVAGA